METKIKERIRGAVKLCCVGALSEDPMHWALACNAKDLLEALDDAVSSVFAEESPRGSLEVSKKVLERARETEMEAFRNSFTLFGGRKYSTPLGTLYVSSKTEPPSEEINQKTVEGITAELVSDEGGCCVCCFAPMHSPKCLAAGFACLSSMSLSWKEIKTETPDGKDN
jgi:hypothetical protein